MLRFPPAHALVGADHRTMSTALGITTVVCATVIVLTMLLRHCDNERILALSRFFRDLFAPFTFRRTDRT